MLIAIIPFVCSVLLLFQAANSPYSLTDAERATWNQLAKQEQQQNQLLFEIVGQAPGLQTDCVPALRFLGSVKDLLASQKLTIVQRDAFLWKLRADHGCPDCDIRDDKLQKPAK